MKMSVKRSISFPDDLFEVIKAESERQQIVFNRIVTNAVREKLNPDTYDADTLNLAEGRSDGMRIIDCKNVIGRIKEIKIRLSEEDAARLKAFANEAGLSVSDLIRRFARYGKVEHRDIVISGYEETMNELLELKDILEYNIIKVTEITEDKDPKLAVEIDITAGKLIDRIDELREKIFKKLDHIDRKGA